MFEPPYLPIEKPHLHVMVIHKLLCNLQRILVCGGVDRSV